MTTTTPLCPAELYLSRRSTKSSRTTAASALNVAARALGCAHYSELDWGLSYADAALIRSSLTKLEPGWARCVWSVTRQVVAEARRLGRIDAETLAAIFELPAPRGSGGNRGRTPTDEEVAELLDTCADDPTLRGRRDAAVLAILAGGGLRRAEASALTVDDFNSATGMLTVRSGKGKKFRVVPLPDWATKLVDEWLHASSATGSLLVAVDRWGNLGGALSGAAVNDIVARLVGTANLEPLTCHGLRRYAITSILRVADVGVAQLLAGHADVSTTIRSYDARGLDELTDAVARRPSPGGRRPGLSAVA